MRDIDSWMENELRKGTPAAKIKRILKAKGYSADVISTVDEAETPYEKKLVSEITRKRFLEALALIIVLAVLAFGALYNYSILHKPSAEEILLNLSAVYGNVTVMKVVGNSMEPAFKDGQMVFVAQAYYKNGTPLRGDVSVLYFKPSNQSVIKRIAAVSFEKIDATEQYLAGTLLLKQMEYYDFTVPPGSIIILGDNPENSLDSRQYGVVSVKNLEGKVVK